MLGELTMVKRSGQSGVQDPIFAQTLTRAMAKPASTASNSTRQAAAKAAVPPSAKSRGATGKAAPRSRRVDQGDIVAHLNGSAVQADRVERAATRAATVQTLAVTAVLNGADSQETGDADSRVSQLQALLAGASPDERKAIKRALTVRPVKPAK